MLLSPKTQIFIWNTYDLWQRETKHRKLQRHLKLLPEIYTSHYHPHFIGWKSHDQFSVQQG